MKKCEGCKHSYQLRATVKGKIVWWKKCKRGIPKSRCDVKILFEAEKEVNNA